MQRSLINLIKKQEGKNIVHHLRGSRRGILSPCAGNETMEAPAAVVGFQMTHTALQGIFQNITYSCNGYRCRKHCGDENVECYLVDNHAFVIAAKKASTAGRFLGDVNSNVMRSLVETEVFEKIIVFDYQAVCFRDTQETNDGNILLTVNAYLLAH
jgi:voltage-dependent calcium channel alpha-2/delta-3